MAEDPDQDAANNFADEKATAGIGDTSAGLTAATGLGETTVSWMSRLKIITESQRDNPVPKMDENETREIFLRVPPDAPWTLARIPVVCKWWQRIVSEASFHTIYRDLHRSSPPVLGFFYPHKFVLTSYHKYKTSRFHQLLPCVYHTTFVRWTPYSPRLPDRPGWSIRDSRHGRVLMLSDDNLLSVWSPITGSVRTLELPDFWDYCFINWQAAVLCSEEGCYHVNCQDGPFRVVMVATPNSTGGMSSAAFYSSDDDGWFQTTNIDNLGAVLAVGGEPSLLVESTLYFPCRSGTRILEYNMTSVEIHIIDSPSPIYAVRSVLLTFQDKPAFAAIECPNYQLKIWSWTDDVWTFDIAIPLSLQPDLHGLSPTISAPIGSVVTNGVSVVLIRIEDGVFAIEVISRRVRMLTSMATVDHAYPFLSFYFAGGGQEHH